MSASLLIAVITMNFIIQLDLPKVNYPTNLDTYVAIIFIFTFTAQMQFAISHYLHAHDNALISEKLDQGFRIWQPVMVFHSISILGKSGTVGGLIKNGAAVSSIIFTILIFVLILKLYREEVESITAAAGESGNDLIINVPK
jgi:hypothetical protein